MWNVATTSRDYQKYLTLSNIISRKQTFLTIKQRYQIHTQLYCYCCSLSLGQVCFLFFESLACFDFLNKCNSKALQVCFLFPKYIIILFSIQLKFFNTRSRTWTRIESNFWEYEVKKQCILTFIKKIFKCIVGFFYRIIPRFFPSLNSSNFKCQQINVHSILQLTI